MSEKLLSLSQNGLKFDMLIKRNNNGFTAFHEASKNGRYEIVEAMLKPVIGQNQFIEDPDQQQRTSLHMAAFEGKIIPVFQFAHRLFMC